MNPLTLVATLGALAALLNLGALLCAALLIRDGLAARAEAREAAADADRHANDAAAIELACRRTEARAEARLGDFLAGRRPRR